MSTAVAFASYDRVGPSGHVAIAVVVTPKDLFVLLDGELGRRRISWTELRRRVGRSGKALLRHRSRACPNPSAAIFFAALKQAGLSLSGSQSHVEFCTLLERRRAQLGLTSRDVARRVGAIASTTAWRALAGMTIPRLRTLLILAAALGVTAEFLNKEKRGEAAEAKPAGRDEHEPAPAPRGDFMKALISFIPLAQRFASDEGSRGRRERSAVASRARDGPLLPAYVTW